MAKLLTTQLSTPVLHFKPGQPPPSFEVKVSNHSPEFATFQLEVLAAGVGTGADSRWYQQAPDLSAKIPPGDRTQFAITIVDVPPVPGGFVGAMNLTVRVFSVELRQEDRQVLNLVIEGSGLMPPRLEILTPTLAAHPQQAVEIPVRLYNPNRTAMRVTLSLQGLPPDWLTDGHERRLEVPALSEVNTTFLGQIGPPLEAPSQAYPFQLEARVTALVSQQIAGTLTVLPAGHLGFELTTPTVVYPPQKAPRKATQTSVLPSSLPSSHPQNFAPRSSPTLASPPSPSPPSPSSPPPPSSTVGDGVLDLPMMTAPASPLAPSQPFPSPAAEINLTLSNQSNLPQTLSPVVERLRFKFMGNGVEQVGPIKPSDRLLLPAHPLTLPIGADLPITLPIAVRRPWLGWTRTHLFRLTLQREDAAIPLQPPQQTVTVRATPRLTWGLQLALLGSLVGLFLLLRWLPPSHRGAVNMVRFDGRGTEVLSASKDQTVRRWGVAGHRLRRLGVPVRSDKAVRVARYRPVGNDAIAVGYENGAAEILSLRVPQPPLILQQDLGDRVFDLQFSPDAQTLFSGYGSGEVRRWDLSGLPSGVQQPVQLRNVGFAVQTLALVGPAAAHLAIGGRFNRLELWDWRQNTLIPLPYAPPGRDQAYITSLATAEGVPSLLAVADDQGQISLWDVRPCLTGGLCQPIEDWSDGHGGQAVRAVALTDDGCYLASGGDDGQTRLWELQGNGLLVNGKTLGRSRQPIESVDILRRGKKILVVSGGRDHRVRLYTVPRAKDCRL